MFGEPSSYIFGTRNIISQYVESFQDNFSEIEKLSFSVSMFINVGVSGDALVVKS